MVGSVGRGICRARFFSVALANASSGAVSTVAYSGKGVLGGISFFVSGPCIGFGRDSNCPEDSLRNQNPSVVFDFILHPLRRSRIVAPARRALQYASTQSVSLDVDRGFVFVS